MTISTDVSSILTYCEGLPEDCLTLAKTTSKLISGWQHVDKVRMDVMIQSMYHLYAVLASIGDSSIEITRANVKPMPLRFADIRYEDYDDLTPELLIARTRDWYAECQELCKNLAFVIQGLTAVDAKPTMIVFLRGHLWTDLMFFERQYKRAFGTDLPSSLLLVSGQ